MKTLEKEQVIALRRRGLSYREIQNAIPVSKGSLSRWLRDFPLTADHLERIQQKHQAIQQQFIAYNQRRHVESQIAKTAVFRDGVQEIGSVSHRELQLLGTALYWAEGAKGRLTSVVEFVNADPAMIVWIMCWFRRCCDVPEHKFRARLQLHEPTRLNDATLFWSRVTGIPLHQFTKPVVKVSGSSQRKVGNRLPYGVIHIRIADVRLLMKIQGWIAGLRLAPSSSPA